MMPSLVSADEQQYYKPLKERKVFHLLNDKDSFYGEKGKVLVFLNDTQRLVLRVSSIKVLVVENYILHIITRYHHWVVLFNYGLDHLIQDERLHGILRLSPTNMVNYEKHTC